MLGQATRTLVRKLVVGLTLVCAVGASPTAHAQDAPPFDPAIDVQLFEYATGLHSFLTVPDADVTNDQQFSIDFVLTFITDPFTIYNVDEPADEIDDMEPIRAKVVENMLAGAVGGAFGFQDKFEVGVVLPMVFSMSGEGLDVNDAMPGDGLQATGLGDLRAELKWRLWQKENLRLALLPAVTLPTSIGTSPDDPDLGSGDLLGDNLPTLRGRAALQWTNERGNLTLGGTLGAIFRKPREIYSSQVGQQLIYGAGANFQVTKKVDAVAEVFGRAGLFNIDLDASPVEVNGAVRIQATNSFSVLVGGGAGLVKGIGSPALRMFLSVGWSPDFRDEDGDGIANDKDDCPLLAEDKDGFEDNDGCPEDDNDGDKRDDSIDKCPNEPEDFDGFEDEDGCPEADNDNDGLLDKDDRCPIHAEDGKPPYDKDGCPASKRDSDDDGTFDAFDKCPDDPEDEDDFEDWDGCPEVDNDNDDIPDEFDECPLCSEDRDNFSDDDGCPELDNDNDGIADANDRCPNEAETINGVDDFDGCPDSGGTLLAQLDGDRVVIDSAIKFRRGRDTLHKRGVVVVDQLAALMLSHSEVIKWRIVMVAPKAKTEGASRRKSQDRADAIKSHIVKRGVSADRVEAIGAVADTPMIAVVVLERAAEDTDENAPKFCPEGMRAVEREPSEDPEPAASEPVPATPAEPAATPEAAPEAAAVPAPAPEPAPAKVAAPAEPAAKAVVPPKLAAYSGVVKGVVFKRDAPVLPKRGRKVLDKVAKLLAANPAVHLAVKVHTDSRHGADKSKAITDGQAETIKAYLIDKGIAAERITAVGRGMDDPIGENKKSKGRAKNRRVEFAFTVKK